MWTFGQCLRMRLMTCLRTVRNLLAGRRLALAQDHRHRLAARRLVDVDRQKAALVIMGVKQRQLLMAVNDIARVVDIQNDRRRFLRVRCHPLIDQRVGEADRVLQ